MRLGEFQSKHAGFLISFGGPEMMSERIMQFLQDEDL